MSVFEFTLIDKLFLRYSIFREFEKKPLFAWWAHPHADWWNQKLIILSNEAERLSDECVIAECTHRLLTVFELVQQKTCTSETISHDKIDLSPTVFNEILFSRLLIFQAPYTEHRYIPKLWIIWSRLSLESTIYCKAKVHQLYWTTFSKVSRLRQKTMEQSSLVR